MFTCKKSGKSYETQKGLFFHLAKVYNNPEEAYLKENNFKASKCSYCCSTAQFLGHLKGYNAHCNSKECIKKNAKVVAKKEGEKRSKFFVDGLKEHIEKNIDFYIENGYKTNILEPFTNKNIKNLSLISYLSRNLNVPLLTDSNWEETIKCEYCNSLFTSNVFKLPRQNKLCSSKNCISNRTNYPIRKHIKDLLRLSFHEKDISNFDRDKIEEIVALKISKTKNSNKSIQKLINFMIKYFIYKDIDFNYLYNGFKNIYILDNRHNNIFFNLILENNPVLANYFFIIQCTNCHKDMKIVADGKNTFCSLECYWEAVKSEENYSRPYKQETKDKQSNTMKLKILEGSFIAYGSQRGNSKTPNLFEGKMYRSSWEVIFRMLNPSLEFEKIVIPYTKPSGSWHTYTTDFQDYENKIIYEVKPSKNLIDEIVMLKADAARKWCLENNWEYKFITEEYFMLNIEKISLDKITDDNTRRRATDFIKRLSKELILKGKNNEN